MAKDQRTSVVPPLCRGGYVARFAENADDLRAAQRLRHVCFVEAAGLATRCDGLDSDAFDAVCDHVLIEDSHGQTLCCFRVQTFASGAAIAASYSAQSYDLKRLSTYADPMVELGRFCVHPDVNDPDVLRIAWGMLARIVDSCGAGLLFGCSSFAGTSPDPYRGAFNILAAGHLAPKPWRPDVKARDVFDFATTAQPVEDRRLALGQVPSLLKTYLAMGGWVSDHAVIDAQMNTLHVFTALEISQIPPARVRALRNV